MIPLWKSPIKLPLLSYPWTATRSGSKLLQAFTEHGSWQDACSVKEGGTLGGKNIFMHSSNIFWIWD